jgi:hypothetical protein
MDETALLAFGILLEEAGREALGKAGDLVFTEAAMEPKGVAMPTPVAKFSGAIPKDTQAVEEPAAVSDVRKAKRRRVAKEKPSATPAS